MASAKEAMQAAKEETESWLFEISDYAQWRTHVMEANLPVILDCYAEWCAPCKKLEPILVEKVRSFQGKLKLVKLNIDDLP